MRRLRGVKRRIVWACLLIILSLLIVVIACDWRVSHLAENKTFNSAGRLPENYTGLLLGTSKSIKGGQPNPYYVGRIAATIELFKTGKIRRLIISGDNGRKGYNEPEMMRSDLLAAGVDSACIYLDYAGFRTLDSVVRCREIFSQDKIIFISQKFHNERAIYIAEAYGIAAVGYNAEDVTGLKSLRVEIRERLARVKVVLDVMLGIGPKFLGEKVEVR
jgi:SanA protein